MLKAKWFFFLILIWQTAAMPLMRMDEPSDEEVIIKCSVSKTTDDFDPVAHHVESRKLKAWNDDDCLIYKYTTENESGDRIDEFATSPKEDSVKNPETFRDINEARRLKRDLKEKNSTESLNTTFQELTKDAMIADFLLFVPEVRGNCIKYFEKQDFNLPMQVSADDEEKTNFANDFVTATDYIFLTAYNILFGYAETDLAKKYYSEILQQFDKYCGDNKTNIEKYKTFLGLLLQYYKDRATTKKDIFDTLRLLIDWNKKTDYLHLVNSFLNKELYKLELFFLHWEDNEEFKNFSAKLGQLLANQKMENSTFSLYDLAIHLVTEVIRNTELGKFSIGSLLIDNGDKKIAKYSDTTVVGYTLPWSNESTLIGIRKPRNSAEISNFNFSWPDETFLLGIRKKRDSAEYLDYSEYPDETWSEDDGYTFESPIIYVFMNLSTFFDKKHQAFAKSVHSIRIGNYNYSWGNANDRKKRNTPEISELKNYKFLLKNVSKWFETKQEENVPKSNTFTVPCFKKILFREMKINKEEKNTVSIANDSIKHLHGKND